MEKFDKNAERYSIAKSDFLKILSNLWVSIDLARFELIPFLQKFEDSNTP